MKIRSGFVSNSSSSSFIFKSQSDIRYSNVCDIAIEILKKRGRDNDKKMLNIVGNIKDKDSPLAFKTVNYDTFISKIDNIYYIFTSANYDFFNSFKNDRELNPSPNSDYLGGKILYDTYYYWPEYSKKAKPLDVYSLDKGILDALNMSILLDEGKCYHSFMYNIRGDIFCIYCKKILVKRKRIKEIRNEN
jgi:hypothetical protein